MHLDGRSKEEIRKQQMILLYEYIIDNGYTKYKNYKDMYKHLNAHQNRSIIQDVMKTKLYQCKELSEIYNRLSGKKYNPKKIDSRKVIRVTELFAEECNYAETLNYLYTNTSEITFKLDLIHIINEEQLALIKLMYLEGLLGSNWEANNK